VLGESKQRLEKLEHLGRQLRAALAGERFEQAALIRDEMRRIRESVSGGDDASADEPSGSREAGRGDH
jgi:protein-arginine kinase activator protein McsA